MEQLALLTGLPVDKLGGVAGDGRGDGEVVLEGGLGRTIAHVNIFI